MNLIGVNGYIGSGKDTVGKALNYLSIGLDKEKIKFEDWDGKFWVSPGYDHGKNIWQIKKFAGKLKQVASIMTGIPEHNFEDQDFKRTYLGSEWDYSRPLYRDHMLQENKYWEDVQMTVREFLQKLGTEAVREGLHTNAWVNALFSDYIPHKKEDGFSRSIKSEEGIPYDYEYEVEYPKWVITDTRFPNEAKAIKDRGGIVIRVNRPVHALSQDNKCTVLHPSEVSLDNWEFDYVIQNKGTVEDLVEEVRKMMDHFSI